MHKPRRAVRWFAMLLIAFSFTYPHWSFGQSATCAEATLMCPDQGATTYPASINAANPDPNNNYGCLGSQPNPAWFYLHVGSTGASTIDLTNSQNQDIDFALWGPFTNIQAALNACGSLPAPTDCSFHPQANETINFPSANPGNIFLLLITNFSNQPTEITASDPMWPNSNFSCIDPACQADAGDIFEPTIEECFKSSNLNLDLLPNYSGNAPDASVYEYSYLLTDASGNIIEDMVLPDLTEQTPGSYQVCGISYHTDDAFEIPGLIGQNTAAVDIDLESNTPPFCGDITNLCVDVIIHPEIPETYLPDEYICPGACIDGPDGNLICYEGIYSYSLIGKGGCDSVVNLVVIEKTAPESFITLDICAGGCTMVAGTQVCAPNPTQIILPGAASNGCDSIINVSFNEISIEAIIDADALEITCADSFVILDGSHSTTGVNFEWKDNNGNLLETLPRLSATQPGEYILEVSMVENNMICTDSASFSLGGNSLPPVISTNDKPEICLGENFDLKTLQINDLNNLNPILTYHSASPATDSNNINSLVSPDQTTTYFVLAKGNGCSEELPVTITVLQPMEQPVISCRPDRNSILFEWNDVGAADYKTIVLTNQPGNQTSDTSFVLNNLSIGEEVTIWLTAKSANGCPDQVAQATCKTEGCPVIDITIEPIDTICQNEINQPIQLNARVLGTDGTGIGIWSGQGVSSDGIFDPSATGAGTWTTIYTFTENNCRNAESLEILVQASPNSDFTITENVCIGEIADFQFSIPTNPNSRMNFDFNFSQNDINAGAGPLGITWSEPGIKTVTFTVEEGKCISSTEKEVTVFEKLEPPTIQCYATETSVEFFWDEVPNATDYQARILNMPSEATGSQFTDLSYTLENLNPETEIEISLTVTQNGSPCGDIEVTQTCVSENCPEIDLVFQPVRNRCFVEGFSEQLSVRLSGINEPGTITWSGDFVSSTGKFEPTGPGIFMVNYTYTWNSCEYFGITQIEIYETPFAAFETEEKVCIDSLTTINFTGSPLPDLNFDWSVEHAVSVNTSVENPQVFFTGPGVSNISLQIEANGCTSNVATGQIQVDTPLKKPQIECSSTETEVKFSWNDDPQTTDYQINVLSGHVGILTGNSFKIEHLQPNTKISMELTALGESACGPVKESAICATKDCPQITFEKVPIPSICINDTSKIQLTDFLKTAYQNTYENWTWEGAGVSSTGTFETNPAGVGVHEVKATYSVFSTCVYENYLTVEVFDAPIADASADETVLDCMYSPISLGGKNNASNPPTVEYNWSGGIFIEKSDSSAIIERPGSYTLTATDRTTGCSSTDEITITLTDNLPELAAISKDISCFGKNDGAILTEHISGGISPYLFALNNDNFSSEKDFDNLSSGNFELIVQDANFCTDTLSFEINEPEELNVQLRILLSDTEIQDGETIEWGNEVTLDAHSTPFSNDLKIEWMPDFDYNFCNDENCTKIHFRPDVTTELTVRVENQNGCTASDTKMIKVKKTSPVFIPSAFSPSNSDGINDSFRLFGKQGTVTVVKNFKVFDRWGALIFENKNFDIADSNHGWDGRFRGKIVDPGVYIFFAEVEFTDGRMEVFEGSITVW